MNKGLTEPSLFLKDVACVCQSVRVKKGTISWWRDWTPHQWEDVCVILEQVRGGGAPNNDIIYISYTHNQEKKVSSTFIVLNQ